MGIGELGMWDMVMVFAVIFVIWGGKRGRPPPDGSFWWG